MCQNYVYPIILYIQSKNKNKISEGKIVSFNICSQWFSESLIVICMWICLSFCALNKSASLYGHLNLLHFVQYRIRTFLDEPWACCHRPIYRLRHTVLIRKVIYTLPSVGFCSLYFLQPNGTKHYVNICFVESCVHQWQIYPKVILVVFHSRVQNV
jgi:hypothetical protein